MADLRPMTMKRLANVIYDDSMANQRFCFILGAGASVTSGIRAAKPLIRVWRNELLKIGDENYFRDCAQDARYDWETCKHIFQPDYEPNSEDYFKVYGLRYAETSYAGYHFLENEMRNAQPSIGYYCLANVMAGSSNKLVITTNFDPLTEDALFYCTGDHPLVLGHESLASFMLENTDRPVVAKIHRDLLFSPMNREEEMEKLKDEWREPLRSVLSQCTPVVVGYAGGDHTLMSLLLEKNLNCKKIYWCTLSDQELPDKARWVIELHNGRWVKIDGFDELMFQIAERFGKVPKAANLEKAAVDRVGKYEESYKELYNKYYSPVKADSSALISDQVVDTIQALSSVESEKAPDLIYYNVLIGKALSLWHQRKRQDAIQKCGEAIALRSDQADAYDVRSKMLHNLKRYDEALADATRAVELDSGNAKYYDSRSTTLHEMERYEEALADSNKAVELDSGNAEYYYSRGVTLHEMKRYEEALEDMTRAVELEPNNAQYYESRGVTLHEMERYEDALADKTRAVELEPNNAQYYESRGVTLHEMMCYKDALEDKTRAVELDPSNAKYYDSRSITLHSMKRYEEAVADSNKAVELDPGNAEYYYSRSATLCCLGRYQQALKDSDEAISRGCKHERCYFWRSRILYGLERYQEALECIDKAMETAPDSEEYITHRKKILEKIKSGSEEPAPV